MFPILQIMAFELVVQKHSQIVIHLSKIEIQMKNYVCILFSCVVHSIPILVKIL